MEVAAADAMRTGSDERLHPLQLLLTGIPWKWRPLTRRAPALMNVSQSMTIRDPRAPVEPDSNLD